MARVDLARRAEIGQERRARTRARISDAAARLLAERSPEALTVDAVVEAAGVAKGTFYYHFDSLEELFAAVGERLAETFDEMLEPARLGLLDPIARISFAFSQLLEKATADPIWARLLVQSLQAPTEFARSVRANLKADLTEAKAQDQLAVAGRRAGSRYHHWGIASGHARYFSTKASGRSVMPGSRRCAPSHRRRSRLKREAGRQVVGVCSARPRRSRGH